MTSKMLPKTFQGIASNVEYAGAGSSPGSHTVCYHFCNAILQVTFVLELWKKVTFYMQRDISGASFHNQDG